MFTGIVSFVEIQVEVMGPSGPISIPYTIDLSSSLELQFIYPENVTRTMLIEFPEAHSAPRVTIQGKMYSEH